MAKKLAIRALQRGVGSMDYVDSLLLMEPEDVNNASDQEHDLAGDVDNQVDNLLTKNQFLNGVNVVAAVQCHKTLKTSAVVGGTVFHNRGDFVNFAWMRNIYNFLLKIRQISAMTDKVVVVALFTKLPTETIF